MAPLLLLEGEAEEDGVILPTAAVNLPTTGEKDPFGISAGQSLMWEAALIADHVSPAVSEATLELLGKCFSIKDSFFFFNSRFDKFWLIFCDLLFCKYLNV